VNQAIQYTLIFSQCGKLNVNGAIITDTLSFSPISVIQTSPIRSRKSVRTSCGKSHTAHRQRQSQLDLYGHASNRFYRLLTSTAFITSEVVDYYPANNLVTATTQVVLSSADVSVSKSAAGHGNCGSEITYLITISNPGQIDAPGVRLTDTLPLSTTFVSATGTPAQPVNGTLVWTLGNVQQPVSRSV